MGMGTSANSVIIVSEDYIKEICNKEYQNFLDALKNFGVDISDFAYWAGHDDLTEYNEKIVSTYEKLCASFKKKTNLSLTLMYHSEDEGDRYDDFFGVAWCLYYKEVYQYTPDAEKIKEHITESYYTVFG